MESAVFLEMLPGYAIIKSRWPDIVGIGGEKVAGTPYIVTSGVVLRETETRDADKILTVLTAEQGKIAVIARGARRKSCKFAACAQPLAYSEWTLYKKGDWYYANEGTTLDLFAGLRTDLAAMALGFYFAELTEAVATEDAPHQELLSHLLNGLYAISVLHKPLPLVKAAFELKLLCLAGYAPLADACAYCGRQDRSSRFSMCWTVCSAVAPAGAASGGDCPLCPDSLAALRHIVYGDAKRLYSFTLGSEAQKRLSAAAEAFLAAQLERGFKTLDFYKSVQGMA